MNHLKNYGGYFYIIINFDKYVLSPLNISCIFSFSFLFFLFFLFFSIFLFFFFPFFFFKRNSLKSSIFDNEEKFWSERTKD